MKRYLELKDISAYRISFDLSNYVWDIVIKYNYFAKDTKIGLNGHNGANEHNELK